MRVNSEHHAMMEEKNTIGMNLRSLVIDGTGITSYNLCSIRFTALSGVRVLRSSSPSQNLSAPGISKLPARICSRCRETMLYFLALPLLSPLSTMMSINTLACILSSTETHARRPKTHANTTSIALRTDWATVFCKHLPSGVACWLYFTVSS